MSSMAKKQGQQVATESGLLSEMLRVGLYKPTQGRIVRQLTFLGIAVIALLVVYELYRVGWLSDWFPGSKVGLSLAMSAIGIWFAFRTVNWPKFSDFLIAVEAEMNKVSWPAWPEIWKASVVVMFVIFAMAFYLWVFDIVWTFIFEFLNIRYGG